jgi:hypothetical protein
LYSTFEILDKINFILNKNVISKYKGNRLIQNKKQPIQLIFGMTSTRKNCHLFSQKVLNYAIFNYVVIGYFFDIYKNSM